MFKLFVLLVICIASVFCLTEREQTFQVFPPGDSSILAERFGDTCFLQSTVAMVGAELSDSTGRVYVYNYVNDSGDESWDLVQTLAGETDDALFGASIFIDIPYAVIGAPGEDRATLYKYNDDETWDEELVLDPADYIVSGTDYGTSVAIDADIIAVGAPNTEVAYINSGAVYVYDKNVATDAENDQWGLRERVTLEFEDLEDGDEFGSSVWVEGDYLYVAAIGKNDDAGVVYVFKRDEGGDDKWGQIASIAPDDLESEALFGTALVVDDDLIAIGAPSSGSTYGVVYIYSRDGDSFDFVTNITSDAAEVGDLFGEDLDVLGPNFVYVGSQALNHDDDDEDDEDDVDQEGAVFLFFRNEGGDDAWGEVQEIRTTTDPTEEENHFGSCVSSWSEIVLIGAGGHSDNVGSAYFFGTVESSASSLSSFLLDLVSFLI